MPKLITSTLIASLVIALSSTASQAAIPALRPIVKTDSVDVKKSFMPLIEHMERSMRYPSQARYDKIQGNVIIQFELTAEGLIANTEYVNDDEVKTLGYDLGDEAVRILKKFKDKKKKLKPGVYILPLTYVVDMEKPPAAIDAKIRKQANCLYTVLVSAGGMR